MAVTITATKYFTGTGPIKFSEIRDTFGDLPGSNVRLSDYKRNSTGDIDWNEDSTISPRVPDATENAELSDADDNIQLSDYRNTIKQYDVEQTGNEEERVYTDGNTTDWNNNLSKNINKNYDVTGTIYANETDKYALTFEEGNYNNLYINVSGNIYGEGGSADGGDGGGALYIHNKYDGDKVRLSITNNGKIWAGGGGGVDGNDGNDGNPLSCTRIKNWTAVNIAGGTHLCNNADGACTRPEFTCKQNTDMSLENQTVVNATVTSTNKPDGISDSNVSWNKAVIMKDNINGNYPNNRTRCRASREGGGVGRTGHVDNVNGDPQGTYVTVNYAKKDNVYQCTSRWTMHCTGQQPYVATGGTKGTKGNAGAGKGWSNRNTSINSAPHVGNAGNAGNCNTCEDGSGSSCGNDGNPGTSGGDWGQNAHMGGSAGIAIRKKKVIFNNANPNNVKGPINNI